MKTLRVFISVLMILVATPFALILIGWVALVVKLWPFTAQEIMQQRFRRQSSTLCNN